MARISEKYNDSCLKMFALLRLLYDNEATYSNVMDLLSDDQDEKMTTAVILNKYLNTLKVFGIKVEKNKHKYYMLSSPYKIDFDKIDLKSIMLFKNSMDLISDEKTKENLEVFLENLFMRFDEDAKTYIESLKSNKYRDLSFFYSQFEKQILLCEKYIKENQKIEVSYIDENGDEQHLLGIPAEMKYLKRKICFVVHSQTNGFNIEIPINKIVTIKQQPAKTPAIGISTTVVYKIKGSLAKSYRLKEHERLNSTEADGNLIIVNNGEDKDSLMTRLVRYNSQCEIISPKTFKEDMVNLLDKMLRNYGY